MAGARRSRKEIEASIAELQAELDTADTDDEIWVKDPKTGHEVKISGRRATGVINRFKDLFDDDQAGDAPEGEEDEEDGDDLPDDAQPGGGDGGYFRGRKK
jgi:hypothetical protein